MCTQHMYCMLMFSRARLLAHPIWCCCSVAKLCLTLRDSPDCSTPGFSVPHHLPEFAQVHVQWIGDAIQPLCSLPPSFLLSSIFLSIRVFPNESVVRSRWLKHWRFSISPSKEYSGLISFKIGWFDLLALQETLKSLLQHHSSKALILWQSSFFIVQLSHLYVTTGKTIAFVGKCQPLLAKWCLCILTHCIGLS